MVTFHGIAPVIADDEVALASDVIHFWRTDDEFERQVWFLAKGLHKEG